MCLRFIFNDSPCAGWGRHHIPIWDRAHLCDRGMGVDHIRCTPAADGWVQTRLWGSGRHIGPDRILPCEHNMIHQVLSPRITLRFPVLPRLLVEDKIQKFSPAFFGISQRKRNDRLPDEVPASL
ncbi:MAG: hypothetical protein STSR0009_08100 [Methanoregula sp.]